MLRRFYNSLKLEDGTLIELSQIWDYIPPTHLQPEEWELEETNFRINGESISREELLKELSTEEFEKLVDSSREDTGWSPPRSDEEHLL